ncbi:MAG: FAD-dependent oxidoreductase, partial [Pseudomonadota bacterium]
PQSVCQKLKEDLLSKNVEFCFGTPFTPEDYRDDYVVNCAGMYADKIATQMGVVHNYEILPLKGNYLAIDDDLPIKKNIYPVPRLSNPFLGVHFTLTSQGQLKVGPTAQPALSRENYRGFQNIQWGDFFRILWINIRLFLNNSFNYRSVALHELRLMRKSFLLKVANKMVKKGAKKHSPLPSGIRAQLICRDSLELVTDFKFLHQPMATHLLNVVSPGFTCAFSLAEIAVDEIHKNLTEKIKRPVDKGGV